MTHNLVPTHAYMVIKVQNLFTVCNCKLRLTTTTSAMAVVEIPTDASLAYTSNVSALDMLLLFTASTYKA